MTFNQAIEEIKKYYPIYQRALDVVEIKVSKLLNLCNYYFIALVSYNGTLILTDIATTVEVFPDVTENEWIEICKKYNMSWNDWHIECEYTGIESLNNFIKLLDDIVKSFSKI